MHGSGAAVLARPERRGAGGLRAGIHSHLFADPRRPPGAGQRRSAARKTHQPQSVWRGNGDSGGRRAADFGVSYFGTGAGGTAAATDNFGDDRGSGWDRSWNDWRAGGGFGSGGESF